MNINPNATATGPAATAPGPGTLTAPGIKDVLIAHGGFYVEDIADASWIAHFPGFYVPSEEEFARVWEEHPTEYHIIKMFGKDVAIPRYQQAYGRAYSFSGTAADCIPATPLIDDLMARLNAIITTPTPPSNPFNMCLCNWYEPKHYIGPHSDDERQLWPMSPIASISWGFARTFVLTPKPTAPAGAQSKHLVLQSGDLVIMGGRCQETHKHEIIKLRKSVIAHLDREAHLDRKNKEKDNKCHATLNRVNFTFRCFKD